MKSAIALFALLILNGCSVLTVRSDGAPPKIYVAPGVVRIVPQSDAVAVNGLAFGAVVPSPCRMVAVGLVSFQCTAVSARSGCVAIVTRPAHPDALDIIGDAARVACAHMKQGK